MIQIVDDLIYLLFRGDIDNKKVVGWIIGGIVIYDCGTIMIADCADLETVSGKRPATYFDVIFAARKFENILMTYVSLLKCKSNSSEVNSITLQYEGAIVQSVPPSAWEYFDSSFRGQTKIMIPIKVSVLTARFITGVILNHGSLCDLGDYPQITTDVFKVIDFLGIRCG